MSETQGACAAKRDLQALNDNVRLRSVTHSSHINTRAELSSDVLLSEQNQWGAQSGAVCGLPSISTHYSLPVVRSPVAAHRSAGCDL